MSEKETSYTAANSMPFKVLKHHNFNRQLENTNKIVPIHIQICPTNVCNLNCPFCSCSNVEKTQSLSIDELKKIVDTSRDLGCKAFTITGGGEPTLHPNINEFISYTNLNNIKMGLVSNGLMLKNINPKVLNKLTWCRVSFSDFRKFDDNFIEQMNYAITNGDKVDWAFSYVVGNKPNMNNIIQIIKYANKNNFTHVRLVPDLYDIDNVNMNKLKEDVTKLIDTKLVIFQNRQDFTKGDKECRISLLKPLIAPDGYIYPCCGVQYSLPNLENQRMFPKQMRMGYYTELRDIINKQKYFNGSICIKCYYQNYNTMLNGLTQDYNHGDFL